MTDTAPPPAPASGHAHYRSVFRPGLFSGQVVWVTGGGSGIGRCVAHELAALGAQVLISGRTQAKLDRVAAEIAEDGGRCDTAAFDIRDEEAVRAGVAAVIARHGPVAGLVNNAGGQFPSPLLAISKKGFDSVVASNLTGGFLMMRELFNQCLQQHGGAVVNMTADFRNGMPGMGHSGAARAGMSNLTATAAFEWAHAGVRVNAVAPGWIASSGMDTYGSAIRALIPRLKNHVPLRRMGVEAEVSGAIVFLLSPAASFITGITLQIDGAASTAPSCPRC
jgi:citronellol/citronellal dehydrogenase